MQYNLKTIVASENIKISNMATAGIYSNLGHQKKEEGVNNNEEKIQDIHGTDPNFGHQKKKAGDDNFKKSLISASTG